MNTSRSYIIPIDGGTVEVPHFNCASCRIEAGQVIAFAEAVRADSLGQINSDERHWARFTAGF